MSESLLGKYLLKAFKCSTVGLTNTKQHLIMFMFEEKLTKKSNLCYF